MPTAEGRGRAEVVWWRAGSVTRLPTGSGPQAVPGTSCDPPPWGGVSRRRAVTPAAAPGPSPLAAHAAGTILSRPPAGHPLTFRADLANIWPEWRLPSVWP